MDYLKKLSINMDRFEKNLFELAKIGRNERGGIDRAFGSSEDKSARAWLRDYWTDMGIDVRMDEMANLWGELEGAEKLGKIAMGSHHDAVPNGGMYDGPLGVLMATEIAQTLIDHHITLRHPLSLVSFTGEEPNEFNISTIGSKAVSGKLTVEKLKNTVSVKDGRPFAQAMSALGGDIEKLENVRIDKGEYAAFLECHIEQGKRLEKRELSCAAVNCITGIYREIIRVTGEANHAGTTLMQDRKDALTASAEYILGIEKILRNMNDEEVTGTIGCISMLPNSANIIPETVELMLDLRISNTEKKKTFLQRVYGLQMRIEESRGVKITRTINLDQPHTVMDEQVVKAIQDAIVQVDQPEITLVSMAGHDAANMASVTRSGMIFVQSVNGKSHCAEEFTKISDIEVTANAMLKAILLLDERLDCETKPKMMKGD